MIHFFPLNISQMSVHVMDSLINHGFQRQPRILLGCIMIFQLIPCCGHSGCFCALLMEFQKGSSAYPGFCTRLKLDLPPVEFCMGFWEGLRRDKDEELDCFPIPSQPSLHGLVWSLKTQDTPRFKLDEKHIPKAGSILFGWQSVTLKIWKVSF